MGQRFRHGLARVLCGVFFTLWLLPAGQAYASDARIRLVVLGDSLADGIWAGLQRNLGSRKHFRIRRAARVSSGLAAYDWYNEAEKLLDDDGADIAVVMVGANDGQAIRRAGHTRVAYRADGWRDEYADKVDELAALFARRNVYAVWIGLPMMRADTMREQAERLNDIFAEVLAERTGVHFLPTWELTTDDNGEYMAYAEIDDSGRRRLFRAKDGVHFTMLGYQYLARHVQEVIEIEYLSRRGDGSAQAGRVPQVDAFRAFN